MSHDVGAAIARAEADIQARLQALETELGTEVSALCLYDRDITSIGDRRRQLLRSVSIGIGAEQPVVRWANSAAAQEPGHG